MRTTIVQLSMILTLFAGTIVAAQAGLASERVFIDIFAPVDRATQHVLWELGQPLLVYLAALGLTLLMNRSRYTRWMVG